MIPGFLEIVGDSWDNTSGLAGFGTRIVALETVFPPDLLLFHEYNGQ